MSSTFDAASGASKVCSQAVSKIISMLRALGKPARSSIYRQYQRSRREGDQHTRGLVDHLGHEVGGASVIVQARSEAASAKDWRDERPHSPSPQDTGAATPDSPAATDRFEPGRSSVAVARRSCALCVSQHRGSQPGRYLTHFDRGSPARAFA